MADTTVNTSGYKTFTATAVAIAEAVRVKLDSSGTISAAGIGEDSIGVTLAAIAASGTGTVQLRNASGTVMVTAAGAVTVGAKLYAAASGKVDDAVTGDFTGLVAVTAASADGDIIEAAYTTRIPGESPAEIVTATNVLAVAESGSTYYLNAAGGFVTTLPAPQLGLRFTFIVMTAPSGGSYTVVTNASANIIKGNQNSVAGDAGDSGTADDTITFVSGSSVAGDKVEVYSDGTSWFAYAISRVAAGVTFTQAS